MNSLHEIVHYLKEQDDFILVGHEQPDPDSLGSMLGLYFGLTQLGKRCRVVSADPIPSRLTWPGLEHIEVIPSGFDPGESCLIVVDCEPNRTGGIQEGVLKAKRLVNFDHHQRDRGIGDLVYVDPEEAATAIIIYRLLRLLDVTFDKNMATALYGGILGDTGSFRHANTSSEVLRISAELMEYGLEPALMAREIFSSQPYGFMQLLGFALQSLEMAQAGRLVWISVAYDDFQQFDVRPEETDNLVNYARMVETAEIAFVVREIKPGECKLGFRSNGPDVSILAKHFGGGGHKLASGATMHGDVREITKLVTTTAEHYLTTGEIDGRNH